MIEVPFQDEELDLCGQGVYWKGALHWHVYRHVYGHFYGHVYDAGESAIMSFDLSEEKFHRVLPVPEVDEDTRLLGLEIHGANLFIYNGAHDLRIEAWITDEYGIGAPCAKWFNIDCSAFINCNTFSGMIPLAYTRSGKFVFLMEKRQMILFNLEDNTYKDYHLGMAGVTEYAIYLETLISPYLGGGAVE
ncbi:hypothetical protein EUGRSUZ_H02932 [Eucalyptus grandis]|uniref:F-box associated beta-propeller type 1 domain-containing protein n=2 Tax=Eucalyptus grandis TaxID=71139 RepID=A0A059B3H3_EUCGR|nr:hypothetical protein EUGRSUZ_H02932 [Eucalyptus grandis]